MENKGNDKVILDSKQAYYIYNKINPDENESKMLKGMGLSEEEIKKEFTEYSHYNDYSLSASGVLGRFFKQLFTTGKSYVLCS